MKVVSKNGKEYYTCPPEKQQEKMAKYYALHKDKCIRFKILKNLETLGRVPTLNSLEKYSISPGELLERYEIFRKLDVGDPEKVREKLYMRIANNWA